MYLVLSPSTTNHRANKYPALTSYHRFQRPRQDWRYAFLGRHPPCPRWPNIRRRPIDVSTSSRIECFIPSPFIDSIAVLTSYLPAMPPHPCLPSQPPCHPQPRPRRRKPCPKPLQQLLPAPRVKNSTRLPPLYRRVLLLLSTLGKPVVWW